MPALMQWIKERIEVLAAMGDEGAAAVEYGLLVALIAVAIIVGVAALGGQLKATFTCVANSISTLTNSC